MPELPEVETIRRQLSEEVVGWTVVGVTTSWPRSFQPSYGEVKRAVVGTKIAAVERRAKLLIFKLSSGRSDLPKPAELSAEGRTFSRKVSYLLFHLKLTGRLLVRRPADPPDEFTRTVFSLRKPGKPFGLTPLTRRVKRGERVGGAVEKELRFADARKFGFVRLLRSAAERAALSRGYGPEPFRDLDFPKFKEVLRGSSRPVKIVLMDQGKISGVGNIYANEALWLAKINPRLPANKVSNGSGKDLYKAVLHVLTLGLKYGGASDNSYVQVHGEKGRYQEHFLVYGRQDQPCSRCRTKLVRVSLGGRGTFYCPTCQQ